MHETDKKTYAGTRKEWREWLRKNHRREKKVWLIKYKKHTKKPSISHRESLEEALCFGWIDTTVKRIDHDTYANCFVRRKENGRWSNATLSYAKKLIKERKMTKSGFEAYQNGLKKKTIDHKLPRNPAIPDDLKKKLQKDTKAEQNFLGFAPSYRRFYIYWIERAKRKETRIKRIGEVFKRAKENRKPNQ